MISIHAPRAGRDTVIVSDILETFRISIHAPRAGRDSGRYQAGYTGFISIHAPRAGRDLGKLDHGGLLFLFQSTRPVRGATLVRRFPILQSSKFQSTRPVRGATINLFTCFTLQLIISIHAPRAGRDTVPSSASSAFSKFQSTRPVRGATAKVYKITLHTFATKGNS